jgi:hypothetical protein
MNELKTELYKWMFNERCAKDRYDNSIINHFEKFDGVEDFTVTFKELQECAIYMREMGAFGDEPFLWVLRFLHCVASYGDEQNSFEKIKEDISGTDEALYGTSLKEYLKRVKEHREKMERKRNE